MSRDPEVGSRLGPARHGGPDDGEGFDSPTVDRFVLANGLEVWHQARPGSGTVSVIMVVRAGARYETQDNNGISHYLEHMLFNGTERWDAYELREFVRRRGGYYNALTDCEYTAYEVHLPAGDLGAALDWMSQLVFHPTLPAEKVDREREVVFQEKGGRSSRALDLLESWGLGYDLGMAVRRRLFSGSTLGFRVAGEDASLNRIDREMLQEYWSRHYRPNNMALIVVGDASTEELRVALEQYMADEAPGVLPPAPETPPPVGREIRVTLKGPNLADRAAMRRGARTVGFGHPDEGALEVLAEVLSNRLTDEVRLRRGLVYAIGAYNVAMSDVGYFVVRTESDAGKMPAIMRDVEQQLWRLGHEALPADELADAKASLRGQFALATQSNASRAWLYAGYAVWCRAGMCTPDYDRLIDAVTAEDLLRVVRQYFAPQNSYTGLYRPALTLRTGALSVAAGLALATGLWLWRQSRALTEPA